MYEKEYVQDVVTTVAYIENTMHFLKIVGTPWGDKMNVVKFIITAHIYLDLARAMASKAKHHALKEPEFAMVCDSKYADYLLTARSLLIKARELRIKEKTK